MYHIKEDKRAKASVELICDGLKRCLKEKSFESVTISDIQRVSGVSRSTFYRNFDRGDMLYASLRRCTSRMRSGLPESGDAALLDYLASIIASSMMGIMITWVERGKKESEEELKGMILQSFKAMKFIGLM
jgi:AcrR family transcriptional regulator